MEANCATAKTNELLPMRALNCFYNVPHPALRAD
jgi:hypothetical protein